MSAPKKSTSIKVFIGTNRELEKAELQDVIDAVLSSGAPILGAYSEKGGRYGHYVVLHFEPGWSDLPKMVEITSFLQLQLPTELPADADQVVP